METNIKQILVGKILAIIFIISLFSCKSSKDNINREAQIGMEIPQYKKFKEFHQDSVAYLKYNFKERKEKYLGQPIKVLLNDLEIRPVKYSCIYSLLDITKCSDITLKFYPDERIDLDGEQLYIYIYMDPELSFEKIQSIGRKYGFTSKWNEDIEKYIGNSIITKIGTVHLYPGRSLDPDAE